MLGMSIGWCFPKLYSTEQCPHEILGPNLVSYGYINLESTIHYAPPPLEIHNAY